MMNVKPQAQRIRMFRRRAVAIIWGLFFVISVAGTTSPAHRELADELLLTRLAKNPDDSDIKAELARRFSVPVAQLSNCLAAREMERHMGSVLQDGSKTVALAGLYEAMGRLEDARKLLKRFRQPRPTLLATM